MVNSNVKKLKHISIICRIGIRTESFGSILIGATAFLAVLRLIYNYLSFAFINKIKQRHRL